MSQSDPVPANEWPQEGTSRNSAADTPLLAVEGLTKHFPIRKGLLKKTVGHVQAVTDVTFDLHRGESLGLVGESGCGKTTTGRTLLRLIEPTRGKILFDGKPIEFLPSGELRNMRPLMQIIFQDPFSSLNPRMTVQMIIGEAMLYHGICTRQEVKSRVGALLERVGLDPGVAGRYPHEFSGGQRQRIGIARALAVKPELIVCDEAVSALDVSVQAQIINLLKDLQEELGIAYLFIAHDLAVVRHIANRIAVMYLGRIVEIGPCEAVFENPQHPYTKALLSAVPRDMPGQQREEGNAFFLSGEPPSPIRPPQGCAFHPRCPFSKPQCRESLPPLVLRGPAHQSRCVFKPEEWNAG